MRKLILALSIILIASHSWGATYYVANNPCSGNTGWSNGSNSNNGLSKAAPFLTIVYSLQQMTGGDTLIIDDGTYTGTSNYIIRDGTQIPCGSSGAWTTIKAENDGKAIFDGQGARRTFQVYGNSTVDSQTGVWGDHSYIEIRGLISKNSSEIGISVGYTHNVKLINCGVVDPADGNIQGINITYASYCLVEGCYAWGAGRYKIATFHSDHTVLRNCVTRFDRSNAMNDPMGDYQIYASTNVEVQNCIAIDGDKPLYWLNSTGDMGSFGTPTTSATSQTGPVNFTNCIALNNHRRFSSVDWNSYIADAHFTNCAAWGIKTIDQSDFIHSQGSSKIVNCTFGEVNTGNGGAVQYSYYNGWKGGNSDSAVSTIWYNFKNGGLFYDVESCTNNLIYGITDGYAYNINGTTVLNTKTYDPRSNGLAYLTRREGGSKLATDNIGATIVKMYGKPGSLWGENGYNLLQNGTNGQADINLWPFPNEDVIRNRMREYSYDNGNLTGKRGFCADAKQRNGSDITLTSYIWEYLGNEIPADIYGTTPPSGNVIYTGSMSGGSYR